MGRLDDLPFKRGDTWNNGETIPSSLPAGESYGAAFNILGKEYEHEDVTYGTGFLVRVRAVRNNSTKNILPGQAVKPDSVSDYYSQAVLPGTGVSGPTVLDFAYSFVADEFLPTAGVVPGDVFWIVVRGPALCKSTATGTPTAAVNQKVSACTANGSTSADAGGVIGLPTTDSTLNYSNAIGRAMSALTSGQTATSILVGVGW